MGCSYVKCISVIDIGIEAAGSSYVHLLLLSSDRTVIVYEYTHPLSRCSRTDIAQKNACFTYRRRRRYQSHSLTALAVKGKKPQEEQRQIAAKVDP